MGVGYHKCQAGSPDGYLDFGVISTHVYDVIGNFICYHDIQRMTFWWVDSLTCCVSPHVESEFLNLWASVLMSESRWKLTSPTMMLCAHSTATYSIKDYHSWEKNACFESVQSRCCRMVHDNTMNCCTVTFNTAVYIFKMWHGSVSVGWWYR